MLKSWEGNIKALVVRVSVGFLVNGHQSLSSHGGVSLKAEPLYSFCLVSWLNFLVPLKKGPKSAVSYFAF